MAPGPLRATAAPAVSTPSSLYSPVGWFSWADAAGDAHEQTQKTPDLMKGFVNTVLGLGRRRRRRRVVRAVRVGARATAPALRAQRGLFLTAGVDVQKDRIEVEAVALGRGKESWFVDYRVIEGDTARAEVWAKLDAVLARDWQHGSGHALIRVMCVDAAAPRTSTPVRQYLRATVWRPQGQPRTAVAVSPYDLGMFIPGTHGNGALLAQVVLIAAISFADDFAGTRLRRGECDRRDRARRPGMPHRRHDHLRTGASAGTFARQAAAPRPSWRGTPRDHQPEPG